jgi:hypothetical protein
MELFLYTCPNCSENLQLEIGQSLTSFRTQYANEYTARIEITPKEIIFNKPHAAILLRVNYKQVRNIVLVPIEEINPLLASHTVLLGPF